MGRSYFQTRRKAFTWLFGAALGAVIVVSRSAWEGTGILRGIFFPVGLLLIGAATAGRLWCSLYICGYKTRTVVTMGPYSICRNPLYFFSLLGAVGVGLATETLTVTALIVATFTAYYPFVIRAEERRLREVHGAQYEEYVRATPRFWPAFARLREPREYVVRPESFRKGALDGMFFIWLAGILKLMEALHEGGVVPTIFQLY